MTIDLDAIQARADAATEGPWFLDSNGVDQVFVGNRADGRQDGLWEIVHMSGDKLGDLKPECAERMRDDAVFIAHAREDVPALVAEVKHFQELVQVLNHRILGGDPGDIEAALDALPLRSVITYGTGIDFTAAIHVRAHSHVGKVWYETAFSAPATSARISRNVPIRVLA